jgi:DNA-binding NarL/FixJ family response regulator
MNNTTTEKNYLVGYHNRLCADGIKSIILNTFHDLNIDIAKNGNSVFNALKSKNYDLLIIDLIYPGCDTVNYLTEIKRANKKTKVLLISDLIQNGMLVDIINSGVDGYILHNCNSNDLETAISKIMDNQQYICTTITTQVLHNMRESRSERDLIQMTSREKEVLSYLVKMHSNKSIAEKLSISELTVKTHRKNLMKKFGSKNLISLVRYACRENLINGEDDEFCKGCPHKHRYHLNYN